VPLIQEFFACLLSKLIYYAPTTGPSLTHLNFFLPLCLWNPSNIGTNILSMCSTSMQIMHLTWWNLPSCPDDRLKLGNPCVLKISQDLLFNLPFFCYTHCKDRIFRFININVSYHKMIEKPWIIYTLTWDRTKGNRYFHIHLQPSKF